MADKHEKAVSVYESLCATLESRNWIFTRVDDELRITFKTSGDDLNMEFLISVDEGRQLLRLSSPMPFTVPEEKRMEMAVAVCAANYGLYDGCFGFSIKSGRISFKMTATFMDSEIGSRLFDYFVVYSESLVEEYNDKFYALAMGYEALEDFIKNA